MEKITIKQVNKYFGKVHILTDINICFESGKIYGIIGRNGSGKTVLFKCICGLMPVSDGTIEIGGKIVGKDIDIPDNLGIIIETPGFLNQFSAYDNLKYLGR